MIRKTRVRAMGRAKRPYLLENLETRILLTTGPLLDFKFGTAPAPGYMGVQDSAGTTSGSLTTGSNYTIAASGYPTLLSGAPTSSGKAWSFAHGGTSPGVDVPNSGAITAIGNTATTTGLSIGFWVNSAYQAATDAGAKLIDLGSNVVNVYQTTVNGVGQMGFQLGNTQLQTTTTRSGGVLDGNWHHIVLTADFGSSTNNVHLYVDGALDPTNGTLSHGFTSFTFGYSGNNNDFWLLSDRSTNHSWAGSVGDVVLFTRALTSTEVNTIRTKGANPAPNVYAGPNQTLSTAGPAALGGSAYDLSTPTPQALTDIWSKVSGPGTVTFTNPQQANSTATFSQPGTYVLQLSASNSQYTTTSTVTETVVTNTAPVVKASSNMPAVVLPANSLSLTGTVSDDGAPYNTLSTKWSVVNTPIGGAVTFANAGALNTTATFSKAGQYIVRLTASDGALTTSSQLTLQCYPTGTGNGAIVVDAGGTHEAWMNTPTVSLKGSYWNTNSAVTPTWSLASGPSGGTVSFASPNSLATAATFNMPGVYTLKLSVTDGTLSGSSTAVVQVYSDGANYGGDSLGFLNTYFKTDLGLNYDYAGFNWSGFSAPGATYSHPRVLISASDIPALITRLTTTTAGQIDFATINAAVTNSLISTTGNYYTMYNDLAAGTTTSYIAANRPAGITATLAYDAFVQMINYNNPASTAAQKAAAQTEGQKVGAALATIAADSYAQITTINSIDFRNINSGYTSREMLGYAYDYGYNFMTAAQQNTVRSALIAATTNAWTIGMETLPSYQSNSSNWIPMLSAALLVDCASVEGESYTDSSNVSHAADATLYPRLVADMQKFFALGMFSDGEMYEGMGKGAIYAQCLAVMAKRGDMLIAATSAKDHIQQFYTASMEPYGYQYTWDEYLGGSTFGTKGADAAVLKYAFPNDPAIDLNYRNALGRSYSNINLGSGQPNIGFGVEAEEQLVRTTLAMDYNTSLTYSQAQNAAATVVPLTYISNRRGLLIARSDWSSDASQLYFQPRSEPGGHSVADRNTFTFSALGKNWVPYIGDISTSLNAAVVSVDGQGPSTVPAAVLSTSDTPTATFMAGDATISYSHTGKTSVPATWNYNQFLANPDEPVWGNLPASQLPQWNVPNQPSGVVWNPSSFQRAFRTAGLIRGTSPYALITDDIQQDNNSHNYTWRMPIADDVLVTTPPSTPGQPYFDVIISNPGSGTNLLVRMLSYNGTAPVAAVSATQGAFTFNYKMLTIATTSVAPQFKVMLYAFKTGTALPSTIWNGNVLTVRTADGQTDQVTYDSSNADGRTRVTTRRLDPAAAVALPGVSVAATDPNADAATANPGTFTITRTGSTTSSLTVRYTVGGTAAAGTDYNALSGIATIPAGQSSTTITVTPTNTGTFHSALSVTLSLAAENTYTVDSTANQDTVTIAGAGAPASALGAFTSVDVGSPAVAGSSSISGDVFTVKGSGSDLGTSTGTTTSTDQFQYDYQPLSGDGDIIARVDTISNTNSGAKAGVMIRENTTDPGAIFAYAGVDQNGTVRFLYRSTAGGTVTNSNVNLSTPCWVKLVRSNGSFSAYYSLDGTGWLQVGSTVAITMATPAFAGLAVTSKNSASLCTATLDDVSINGNGVNATPIVALAVGGNAVQSTSVVGGSVIVTRDNSQGDLTVNYTVGGTAVAGTDYAALPGTVIIPNGENAAAIPITPIGTAAAGSSKTVIITLGSSPAYTVSSANAATVAITEAGTQNAGPGPVVWYAMDQTPNRNVNGIIDNTGHTAGTISTGSGTPAVVAGANSNTGNAWNFGSTGAGITVGGTSTNSYLNSLGDTHRTTGLTVAYWVNEKYVWNTDNNKSMFSFGKVFSGSSGQDSTNHIYTNMTIGPINTRTINTLDGTWHFMVFSADFSSSTNNMTVYVDGVQTSVGWLYNNFSSYSYNFAAPFNDPSNPNLTIASGFRGGLDEFMVFNRPVSAAEVQSLYTASDKPTATVAAVAAMPVVSSVPSATITFDRAVTGLTTSDLSLTRDGVNVPLSGVTLTPSNAASTTTYTLSGLSALTSTQGSYVLTVTASSSIKDANNVSMIQNAVGGWVYYAAPTALAAAQTNPNSVHLSWTNNTSAGTLPSIQVQRSLDGTSNWQTLANLPGTATSYDDTSASDGTQYFYRLNDTSAAGTSANSNTAMAVTPLLAPTISSLVQQANQLQATLTWIDNTTNGTSVTIDRSSDGGSTWQNLTSVAANIATYTDSTVSSGNTYIYRLQTVNGITTSAYVTTNPLAIAGPSAPTIAMAAAASPNPTSNGQTTLSVMGADAGGEPNLIYTWSATGPGTVNFSDNASNSAKNITASFGSLGTYTLTVQITNAANQSVTSSVTVTSSAAVPAATTVSAYEEHFAQIAINWNAVSGAATYNIKRATTSSGPYTSLATGLTTTNYVDTTAAANPSGTSYYYIVTGVNWVGGIGADSTPAAVTETYQVLNFATGGVASASSQNAPSEGAAQAFDGTTSTKWYNQGTAAPGWLQYDLGAGNAIAVTRYDLSSANDVPGRDPANWQFQGSNDGTTWSTLDTQSNQVFSSRLQTKQYAITNSTAYRYYRLNILSTFGTGGIQLSEMALMANANVLPTWVSPSSLASWNPSSSTLTVYGATTITADPGAVEPIIQAIGSSAVLTISPSTSGAVHIGGLSLTNGASATLSSLGASRTVTNYRVLVLGVTSATAAPLFNIDATSTLDLADNDMIDLYGSGATPFTGINVDLANAYHAGAWDQTGLTSTNAGGSGRNTSLGIAESSKLNLSSFDGVTLGSNAVLVKYTVAGDTDLSGTVDGADYNTVISHYNLSGQTWSTGNFDYTGTVSGADYNVLILHYNASIATYLAKPVQTVAVSAAAKLTPVKPKVKTVYTGRP